MLNTIINVFAACFCAFAIIGCSGNEPATPEQQKDLTAAVETAAGHLKESKQFAALPAPKIPEITGNGGDFYTTPEKELRFLGKGVTAAIRNDSAEVLFSLTIQKDSAATENRDALVRLVRDSGTWRGSQAVIVGK